MNCVLKSFSGNPNTVVLNIWNKMSKSFSATDYFSVKPWLLRLSFSLCCFYCYHNHSEMSSFKCDALFLNKHLLEALRSFSTISCPGFLFFLSEKACGLKLFKCSLLRTFCLITYLLDLLSHIFFSKINSKKSARFSSSQREEGFKELKTNKKHWFS